MKSEIIITSKIKVIFGEKTTEDLDVIPVFQAVRLVLKLLEAGKKVQQYVYRLQKYHLQK